jgi:hypothetical protein
LSSLKNSCRDNTSDPNVLQAIPLRSIKEFLPLVQEEFTDTSVQKTYYLPLTFAKNGTCLTRRDIMGKSIIVSPPLKWALFPIPTGNQIKDRHTYFCVHTDTEVTTLSKEVSRVKIMDQTKTQRIRTRRAQGLLPGQPSTGKRI